MTHAGKTAVWYCDGCTEEQMVNAQQACPLCGGFRLTTTPNDLTDGMLRALVNEADRRSATSIAWGSIYDAHKSSLYALERRGLLSINRYRQRMRLTAAGIRLANEITQSAVQS